MSIHAFVAKIWPDNFRRLRLGEEKKRRKKERNYRAKIYMVSILHRATITRRMHLLIIVTKLAISLQNRVQVTGKSSVTKTLFRINAQQSHTNISYCAKTESIQHCKLIYCYRL